MHSAINNGLLDTYQLKSLDGLLESDISELGLRYVNASGSKGHFTLSIEDLSTGDLRFPQQTDYDIVIRCMGFLFDKKPFK